MTGPWIRRSTILVFALWAGVASAAPLAAQEAAVLSDAAAGPADTSANPAGEEPVAVLQGLDKITARVSTFVAPIDEVARFGTLDIVARACDKKPPTETPESAAYLEIVDVRPDSPAVEVFNGWMFASSPAISALEHPVYDVWVIDCRKRAEALASGLLAPPEDELPEAASHGVVDSEDPGAPPPED